MRCTLLRLTFALCLAAPSRAADKPLLLDVWPDKVPGEKGAVLYLALKKAGVPAELHIFATGGHGFGIRPSKQPASEWPKRCEDWLRTQKVLEPVTEK